MPSSKHDPMPVRGLAAGLAGGLIASFAMDAFQGLWGKLVEMPDSGTPATVKAADSVVETATGRQIPESREEQAGQIVHYLFGAGLGAAYGLITEYRPSVTAGGGSGFALATATLFDEFAVPASGLGGSPLDSPPKVHAYAYASHLVFGTVTEAVRRTLRSHN